jgi:hypothetical protein
MVVHILCFSSRDVQVAQSRSRLRAEPKKVVNITIKEIDAVKHTGTSGKTS